MGMYYNIPEAIFYLLKGSYTHPYANLLLGWPVLPSCIPAYKDGFRATAVIARGIQVQKILLIMENQMEKNMGPTWKMKWKLGFYRGYMGIRIYK